MKKPTPNPPESNDTSPYESADSKKLHEAAERALDHHFNPIPKKCPGRRPSQMFQISPDMDDESLLAHACESLATASVMASDVAAFVDTPQRHRILGIQQVIMLAELAVNRVLDNVEVQCYPTPS
ncbi:DUF6124 family protein [Pseudomonas sp. DR 5-09]|uniref:DUF6124 family protein n=1 Tax=Pseudomonas sp. DR 5-09 TaxID=1534110 RepID=UPI0007DCDA67|nr:DUF6124 family protein [Pseudomonas sp. DR 5-09]ANI56420.1 hypothetical protein PDR5_46900 [Pseudomonas sp. DR 5-09]